MLSAESLRLHGNTILFHIFTTRAIQGHSGIFLLFIRISPAYLPQVPPSRDPHHHVNTDWLGKVMCLNALTVAQPPDPDLFIVQASPVGVLGTARMSLSPMVIMDSLTVHQSTSSQPCLANVGIIQHASCYVQGMTSRLSYDSNVPCIGNPISTVASSDASRVRRRLEL